MSKMTKDQLPAGTDPVIADQLVKVYDKFDTGAPKYEAVPFQGNPGVFKVKETPQNRILRNEVMKAVLKPAAEGYLAKARIQQGKGTADDLAKASVSTASNITPYDLRAPSLHLVPWLSPIRESLPRIGRPNPGTIAHWKAIIANSSSYQRGGAPSIAWINEGQRAPLISLTALNASAAYASIGVDGNVTYEGESASQGFEDALASAHFFALETLMVKEEDALLGGNYSLALGTAATPTGTTTGSGGFTANLYAYVVELTYEGYRDYVLSNGLNATTGLPNVPVSATVGVNQQSVITTLDAKTMTVNRGCGQESAASAEVSPSSSVSATFSVVPATGALAWAWYVGTSASTAAAYLQGITTVPSYTMTATRTTTGQLLSNLTVGDFSVNNGSTGGGTGQVTGFDGLLTQAFNNTALSPQNAYVSKMAGATLTTSGKGNVDQIDTMLVSLWNNYKVTVDVIYVNAQELTNITSRVLNGSSAPLLRYDQGDTGEGFDLTGYGVISFYHNPYIPGGRKIPIIVHPTLPPGTILGYAKTLPPYFKTNATPNVAEVLTRRDYYSKEWADVTREYQFGVYSEEVLAVYAPFCLGVICGIGNG